jgi:hypothetical protein
MTALRLATASVISLLLATSAFSGPDRPVQRPTDPSVLALITNDDSFSTADLTLLLAPTTPGANAPQHYGPYTTMSPDSGTCGNDWATDTFDRHFTVKRNPDGTFLVIQQFKNGSFVTNTPAGFSPGSCDNTDGSRPGTVDSGITGDMHGYFIISGATGQTSTDPHCDAVAMTDAGCTTTIFLNTHLACATCSVTTFFFHYSAGDQLLVEHEWKNASADRGGNHGDIRSTNIP